MQVLALPPYRTRRASRRPLFAVCAALALLLAFAAALLCPRAAAAGAVPLVPHMAGGIDPSREIEFLHDPDGRLDIDWVRDAPARAWQRNAVDEILNLGLGGTIWLRVSVAPTGAARDWLLEVAFAALDSVTIYAPLRDGSRMHATGDGLPFSARMVPHRHFVFPLALPAEGRTTIYLRVSTNGSVTVPLRFWQDELFADASRDRYALLALYYGAVLGLALYNLLLYFSLRDRVYLDYVGLVVGMAIGHSAYSGFGAQFLWPEMPAWDRFTGVLGLGATGGLGAVFARRFLNTPANAPEWVDRALRALAWAFVPCVAMLLVSYRTGLVVTSAATLVFTVLVTLAGFSCWRRGSSGAGAFLVALAPLLAGVLVFGMRTFQAVPTNGLTLHAWQLGAGMMLPLLAFALADRVTTAELHRRAADHAALQAKEDEVTSMRVSGRVLAQRVADRTRELEAANKALERARNELALHQRTDPLTQLPDRVALEERVNAAIARASLKGGGFALLLVGVVDIARVVDAHGHAVAAMALRELPPRMFDVLRATDMVARVDDQLFAVVLENVRSADVAGRTAYTLGRRLAEPVRVSGLDVAVGTRIGVALYPAHGGTVDELLAHARQAVAVPPGLTVRAGLGGPRDPQTA